MSLESWSLLYFAVSAFYYFSIYISLFTTLNVAKILFNVVAFTVLLGVTLAYGINTGQTGLIFLAGLQLLIVMLMFIQYGRLFNENNDS